MLVCSAGITGPNAPTWDYPVDAWRQVMDVNVNGLFYCNRAVVPVMRKNDYGRIVNIASVAGKEGNPNASAYSTSKAAVIGLTKSLGKELAKTGIRVNCVTPAAVRTAIFDQMSQQHIDFMLSKIPMGRFGTVDEIAALVCWLASEDCSFSTGAVFDASGGRATYRNSWATGGQPGGLIPQGPPGCPACGPRRGTCTHAADRVGEREVGG